MSNGPKDSAEPPEEERLSGTLFGGLQSMSSSLGWLSAALMVVGVAALILGIVVLIFIGDLRLYGYIILGIGAAILLASMVISLSTVSRAVTGRRGRYSTNTAIMVVAFLGIAAVVNFLGFENRERVDVTATDQFSLAPRTEELLKNLDQTIEVRAFFVPPRTADEELLLNLIEGQTDDMLREFSVRNNKFSYEFIDPIIDPLIAREYGVSRYPSLVFESKDSTKRHQVAPSPILVPDPATGLPTPVMELEQQFVTALLIVTGQEQKQVYFLTGHDERDINDSDANTEGYGRAVGGIIGENYAVSTINLLAEGKDILEGDREEGRVNMLVVSAPKTDLLEGEGEILDDYLKDGGNILFLLEPDTPPGFRSFLARWGVVVGDGHVVDLEQSFGDNNEITFLRSGQYFGQIPIPEFQSLLEVDRLTLGIDTTYYPGLTPLDAAEGVLFYPTILGQEPEEDEEDMSLSIIGTALAMTSEESFLIEDPTRNEPQEGDARGTFLGAFFPAVALKALGPLDEELADPPENTSLASIVAFGDSDFASNRYFFDANNSDFFLNSVNWLVGDIDLASIRPKVNPRRDLALTDNEKDFMRFSSWLLLPLIMVVLGGFVWWRRR